jgi:Ca2+-binding EF-hand superfamily protein
MQASEPMSAESLEALIREVDVDGDGYVSQIDII